MANLIVEIGTEELPAGYVRPAHQWLEKEAQKSFVEMNLSFRNVECVGTPRRMTLMVKGLMERQSDTEEEVLGPKSQIAWGPDGQLSKAGQGFLRGRGLSESDAYRKEGPKGEVIAAVLKKQGKESKDLLAEALPKWLKKMPFPKKMRWRDEKDVFARPVRWLYARLGEEVVNFSFAGIDASLQSYGHRFHYPEQFIPSQDFEKYESSLMSKKVNLRFEDRRKIIEERGAELAASIGGFIKEDEALMDLVSNLVEWPVPLLAKFEDRFLEVPQELLLSEMREHQKYFGVVDNNGKLLPYFVFVAGSEPTQAQKVIDGNLRVITSRFEDGAFYYKTDLETPLSARQEKLKSVMFERQLGTLFEKVERIQSIVSYLTKQLDFSAAESQVCEKAAILCKNDIVSGVVGEFPDLQGVMANYYISHAGESSDVAEAIEGHYSPRNRQDSIASSKNAAVIAIADRLDTLVGILGIGKAPTGSADPFALRRAAIAIADTIIGHRFELNLRDLVEHAAQLLEHKISLAKVDVVEQCITFFETRLLGVISEHLEKKGFSDSKDISDAVMSAGHNEINDALYRAECIAAMRRDNSENFTALAATFKRVSNILKKADKENWSYEEKLSDSLELKEEIALSEACQTILNDSGHQQSNKAAYDKSFAALVDLKPLVDQFFDGVMVMSDDENEKFRRLSLLAQVNSFLKPLADFSRIQGA